MADLVALVIQISVRASIGIILTFLKFDFRERKGEKETLVDASLMVIEPTTFWRNRRCSNKLSDLARAHCGFDIHFLNDYSH